MATPVPASIRTDLAPTGTLRVGLNHSNFLLVQTDAAGKAKGIAADLGRELGARLGVPVELIKYESPGTMAEAAMTGAWDVAFLGAEPARANQIHFTAAYLEIEATYLVPPGSPIKSVAEVDRAGVRIAVSNKSAYELYLSRNIQHAKLVKVEGIEASYDIFVADKLEALAGLRPRLVTDVERLPGARILEGRFTAVQQAIGTPKNRGEATARFLREYAEDVKATGLVAQVIERHGIRGVNVAAKAAV
jgi:polar amino acid transport system substrate-binding protein